MLTHHILTGTEFVSRLEQSGTVLIKLLEYEDQVHGQARIRLDFDFESQSRSRISPILRNSKRLYESKVHFDCFLQPQFGVGYFLTSPNDPKCNLDL